MPKHDFNGRYKDALIGIWNERKPECPDECSMRCDRCMIAISQIPETLERSLPEGVENFEVRGPKWGYVVFRRQELLEA